MWPGVLWVIATFAVVAVSTAEPPPDNTALKELAGRIAAAPENERDPLIASAPPESHHELRHEVMMIVYRRGLEGDYLAAEALSRFTLAWAERERDADQIAENQQLLSTEMREVGETNEAIALCERSLAYFEEHPDKPKGMVKACQWLGMLYTDQGDFARSLAYLDRAVKISREIDYKDGLIPALNSTGELFRKQGQPERALSFYEQAREITADDNAWNMAFLWNNIGECYEVMGEFDKALDAIERARSVAEKAKMRPRVATSLAVIGDLHLQRREYEDAAKSYEASRAIAAELHDAAGEARALLGLAEASRLRGDYAAALKNATHAADLYRRAGLRSELASAETSIGRCLHSLGKTDEARQAFEEAIAETERVRGQLAGGASESESFFAARIAPYREMVALLVQEDRPADALLMSERGSARVLLDILAGGKNDIETSMSDAEREQARQLARHVAELNHRFNQSPNEEIQAQLVAARDARESFEAQMWAEHRPQLAHAQVASLDETMALVRGGKRALLKYLIEDDETLLFVVNEGGVEVFHLKIGADEVSRRATDLHTKISQRALNWQPAARELYDALVRPAAASLSKVEQLIIVPDGVLWDVPFQALQDEGHALIETREIGYAPSLSFLARTPAKPPLTSRDAQLLAVANPALGSNARATSGAVLMGEDWQPLPAAEEQVAELARMYSPEHCRTLVGANARERVVKSEAPNFDILHFATHGILNDHAPLYSYLLLSQENLAPDEDGMLEAWELMRLPLRARLAVLSACETARGKVAAGEGIIGLSWALLVAGCPTTVVSQWKVDSASNTELMVEFHRRLRDGATPVEALRAASLALAKDARYGHPFYWAPFVVVGAP